MTSYVYVCATKLLGFPFVVMTEEEAVEWVKTDPETRYYDKVVVRSIEVKQGPNNA